MRVLAGTLLLTVWASAGCGNTYSALTAPPPGLTASLDHNREAIQLSRGVALGFECSDAHDDPCSQEARTDDPGIALIFPAALDTLGDRYALEGPQPRSAFVVVAIAAGDTHVHAGGGALSVRVLPPP